MALRRVGIYGGTFDPVHNGHVEVARRVLQFFELDEVIFVPACVPPHKRNLKLTSAFHRFAMLAVATEMDQRLLVSTIELDAPDRPYAVDTVARMKDVTRRLFFIVGADSWGEIATWREWRQLMAMCDLIVATRPGHEIEISANSEASLIDLRGCNHKQSIDVLKDQTTPHVFLTDVAMVDVSATSIRAAIRANDFVSLNQMGPSRWA